MNGNTNNSTGVGSSVGDDSRTRSCEFSNDIGAGTATGTTTTTPASSAAEESHEEECVICLEELSSQDWGRCTPCGHTFHKKCWWEWENAHNQRIDEQQRRLSGSGGGGRRSRRRSKDPGPKCCLCNTVNKQFLDRSGDEPAHNPSPYIASDDDPGVNNSGGGGNRFTNWFRDIGQEASGFVNFLQNNLGDNSGQPFPGRRSSTFRNSNGNVGGGGGGGSGADSPSNANNNPFNLLLPGTEVVIQGLVNSPHLNQKRGVVVQYFPQSARYSIQLETNISNFIAGTNAPVAIKPENLLQTAKVKIHGLRSQPSLNGSTGTICAYSKERNRYVVKVDFMLVPTREISIQPCNILIPNGTCVRLEGLQQASQWNGKYGTIARWVESSNESSDTSNNNTTGGGRYEVRLSRQYGVRVKMENVRL